MEITTAYHNPYDKAAAITNYLRSEIEYAPSVSFPEGTVDRLEYFLFEGKQGFCNYYASAEVLMLRSVGVPARLAVGFAQGEPNLQRTFYTVRERDAHAWPEVYFPGYGWIEFEPTGNQAPIERLLEREEQPDVSLDPAINPSNPEELAQEEPESVPPTERQDSFPSRAQIVQLSLFGGISLLIIVGFFLK